MKLRLLIALMAFAIFYACSEAEQESIVPSSESVVVETSERLPFEIYPIEQLSEISNGLFWLHDEVGQAYAFADGALVCQADYPQLKFEQIKLKPNAKPGFYKAANDMILFDHGVIITDFHPWKNCVTNRINLPRDCPPGHIGAISVEVTNCYSLLTGALLSSDTVTVGGIPCVPIEFPEFKEYYFEDEYGNLYQNPICF